MQRHRNLLRACATFAILLLAIGGKASAIHGTAFDPIRSNLKIPGSAIDWKQRDAEALGDSINRVQMAEEHAGSEMSRGQSVASEFTTYFLPPETTGVDLSTLPKLAREVVVARVRVIGLVYLIERDQSGRPPPSPLPKDRLSTLLKIVETRSGSAPIDAEIRARFAPTGQARNFIYPATPEQEKREYVVVTYVDEGDNIRRLAEFPVSQAQYSAWRAEVSGYNRAQGKPGVRH